MALDVSVQRANRTLQLHLCGDINAAAREPLLDHVAGEVGQNRVRDLVLDLTETTALDADGIGILLECTSLGRQHGIAIRITGVPGASARELERWDAGRHLNWS